MRLIRRSMLFVTAVLLLCVPFAGSVHAESATPVYEWTHYIETVSGVGASIDDIEVAPDGSVYAIGGMYDTVDFDPRGSGDVRSLTSSPGIFVTKRGSDGSYQWTRVLESDTSSLFVGFHPEDVMKVDAAGNVYFMGIFRGTVNFDPTGSDIRTSIASSQTDTFVTKWNADGSYGWTHTMGSPATPEQTQHNPAPILQPPFDSVTMLDVLPDGTAFVVGNFVGTTDFDANGAGDIRSTNHPDYRDAYITRINSDGSYGWTETFGGSGGKEYFDTNNFVIADDNSGIYGVINFESPTIDIDPGPGITTYTATSPIYRSDLALFKLDFSGNFIWGHHLGEGLFVRHMKSDSNGNLYLTGDWANTVDFDPTAGTDIDTFVDFQNGYLTRFDSDGSYGWSRRWKPTVSYGFERQSLEVTNDGVYVSMALDADAAWDINHPATPVIVTPAGGSDMLLSKWTHEGGHEWYRLVGGTSYDYAYEMSVDQVCNSVYQIGESYGDPGGTPIALDGQGGNVQVAPDTGAIIASKFSTSGNYIWSNFVDTSDDFFYATRMVGGPADSAYYSGWAEGSAVNFNSFGSDIVDTSGQSVAFITKIGNTNYRQHVVNLGTSVNAQEESTGDSARLGDVGVNRTSATTVRIPDADNSLVIADIDTDLSCDRDWASVGGDADNSAGQAYIANLTSAEGTASTLDLYVPVTTGSLGVGICPGATSLASLNSSCSGYYELANGDAGLSSVNIGGQDYWQVLGITDSGGFNLTELGSPPPAESPDPSDPSNPLNPPELVDTGVQTVVGTIVVGLLIVTSTLWLTHNRYRLYYHYLKRQ